MTGRAWVWIYFFRTSQQSGHAPAACTYKSSLDVCFVGNAHYMRFTCHVSYHLVNTQEQASGSITDAGNRAAAKGPISSPRATLPGISPAFIQTRSRKVLFPLPECSETLNLPEDCRLSACLPSREGTASSRASGSPSTKARDEAAPAAPLPLGSMRILPGWTAPAGANTELPEVTGRGNEWQGHLSWSSSLALWDVQTYAPPYISTFLSYLGIMECYLEFKSALLVLVSFQILLMFWKITSLIGKGKENFKSIYPRLQKVTFPGYCQQIHNMPNQLPAVTLTDCSVSNTPEQGSPGWHLVPNPSLAP